MASALKGAARFLLGYDVNNLSSLPVREGAVRKVVIFETDGMPDEAMIPSLLTLSDVMATGWHAAVAARVKKGGTVVVVGTIGIAAPALTLTWCGTVATYACAAPNRPAAARTAVSAFADPS